MFSLHLFYKSIIVANEYFIRNKYFHAWFVCPVQFERIELCSALLAWCRCHGRTLGKRRCCPVRPSVSEITHIHIKKKTCKAHVGLVEFKGTTVHFHTFFLLCIKKKTFEKCSFMLQLHTCLTWFITKSHKQKKSHQKYSHC